jgi:hypothetical protein
LQPVPPVFTGEEQEKPRLNGAEGRRKRPSGGVLRVTIKLPAFGSERRNYAKRRSLSIR